MRFKCLEGPQEAAALGNVVSYCLSGEPFLLFIRKSYPEQPPSFLAQEVYSGRDLSNLHFTVGETREGTCPGSPGSLLAGHQPGGTHMQPSSPALAQGSPSPLRKWAWSFHLLYGWGRAPDAKRLFSFCPAQH